MAWWWVSIRNIVCSFWVGRSMVRNARTGQRGHDVLVV